MLIEGKGFLFTLKIMQKLHTSRLHISPWPALVTWPHLAPGNLGNFHSTTLSPYKRDTIFLITASDMVPLFSCLDSKMRLRGCDLTTFAQLMKRHGVHTVPLKESLLAASQAPQLPAQPWLTLLHSLCRSSANFGL